MYNQYLYDLDEEPIRISHHERSVRAHSVAVVSNSLPGDSSSFHGLFIFMFLPNHILLLILNYW